MSEKADKDTSQDMENGSSNQSDISRENLDSGNLDRENLEQSADASKNSSSIMSDVLDAVNSIHDGEGKNFNKEAMESQTGGEGINEISDDPIINELKSKQAEIDKLQAELAASQDKYLRALADFENFKKRSLKERSELLKYQGEQVILDMVRVFDDLELAVQFASQEGADTASDPQKIVEGLRMIHKNFVDALAKWDIKAESAVGKVFDPQKHMAISKVPVADTAPGTVVSELKKVYFYKDKILRVGEVIVAAD